MPEGFVIDASVVMSWCFEDEDDGYSTAVLESLAEAEAFAPSVWALEVGNVIVVAERKKRLGEASSVRFLALLAELPIKVEEEPPGRMLKEILSLARAHRLSTYDASYLDLAMRLGLPIATLDEALISAAQYCSVPIYAPAGALSDF